MTPGRHNSLLEEVITQAKYDIAGVRSGTIVLKPDWLNLNDLSHPEADKFIAQQTEANIRGDTDESVDLLFRRS
jgi:hypothetical protein